MTDTPDDDKPENKVKKAMAGKKPVKRKPALDAGSEGGQDTPKRTRRPKAEPQDDRPEPPPHDDAPEGDEFDDDDVQDGAEDYSEAERIIVEWCARLDQNDRDNGRRLVAWFGSSLVYVTGLGWLVWRETYWQRDEADLEVRLMAQSIVDMIKREAFEIDATDGQKRLLELAAKSKDMDLIRRAAEVRKQVSSKRSKRRAWAVTSGNAGKTSAMLEQARSLKALAIEKLDADHRKFNVRNGTLRFWRERDPDQAEGGNAKVGRVEFLPHDRADLITKMADVEYVPGAECPFFEGTFLSKVQTDARMRLFLQVSTAYTLLLGGNDEQRLFFHYGTGANGKSAFFEVIGRIAATYRSIVSPNSITGDSQSTGQQANPDIARLHNTRMVTIEELPKKVPLREELIKALTGGTKILARYLNKEFFEFMPQFTPMLSGNSKPGITGTDHGIWRRVLLVPWLVTISEAEKIDPTLLAEKLDAERSGILNWLIDGVVLYLEKGLVHFIPEEVTKFTQDYREDRDNVGVFAEFALEADPGHNEPAGPLYTAYKNWCEVNGLQHASQRAFGDKLVELGYEKQRGNYYKYLNVRLKPTASKFDPTDDGL